MGLSVVALQPNCPIQFEEVTRYAGVEGESFSSYRIRNDSAKQIRRFTVATSHGEEYTRGGNSGELLMSGQLVTEAEDERIKIVSLNDKLRDKLKFKGTMQDIIVLVAVSVENTDSTKFSDEVTYKSLQTYMGKVFDAVHEKEQREKPWVKP